MRRAFRVPSGRRPMGEREEEGSAAGGCGRARVEAGGCGALVELRAEVLAEARAEGESEAGRECGACRPHAGAGYERKQAGARERGRGVTGLGRGRAVARKRGRSGQVRAEPAGAAERCASAQQAEADGCGCELARPRWWRCGPACAREQVGAGAGCGQRCWWSCGRRYGRVPVRQVSARYLPQTREQQASTELPLASADARQSRFRRFRPCFRRLLCTRETT